VNTPEGCDVRAVLLVAGWVVKRFRRPQTINSCPCPGHVR